MRTAAIIVLALGMLTLAVGLVSCQRYYSVPRAPAPHGDTEGDTGPYVAFQRFFLISATGVIGFSIGIYLFGRSRQKDVEHG